MSCTEENKITFCQKVTNFNAKFEILVCLQNYVRKVIFGKMTIESAKVTAEFLVCPDI